MKVLITGGSGFLGHFLVQEFLQDHEVVCMLRPNTKNLDRLTDVIDDVEVLWHDIKYPCAHLAHQLSDVDIILHAGANPSSASSLEIPVSVVEDNVMGTLHILELARRIGRPKVVYYSTGEVFGPVPIGTDSQADDAYKSNSPYAASKAAGEELCVAYSNSYGLPVSIIHVNNTFGPRSQSNRLPVIAIGRILNNQAIDIHVGLNNSIGGRRWFYAGDVASHTRFILNNQVERCEKWNSAGDKFVSNLDLAKDIANALGKQLQYNLIPIDRPGHDLCFSVAPDKLYERGWVAPKTYAERLTETAKWYLQNLNWLTKN